MGVRKTIVAAASIPSTEHAATPDTSNLEAARGTAAIAIDAASMPRRKSVWPSAPPARSHKSNPIRADACPHMSNHRKLRHMAADDNTASADPLFPPISCKPPLSFSNSLSKCLGKTSIIRFGGTVIGRRTIKSTISVMAAPSHKPSNLLEGTSLRRLAKGTPGKEREGNHENRRFEARFRRSRHGSGRHGSDGGGHGACGRSGHQLARRRQLD